MVEKLPKFPNFGAASAKFFEKLGQWSTEGSGLQSPDAMPTKANPRWKNRPQHRALENPKQALYIHKKIIT